mmetsp:Transcript_9943/g.14651  ORF Transcript_9943/g.14651 Transcript_9943/m.14651 type:complete len:408 (+) Transcript_9943:54-1277(+)
MTITKTKQPYKKRNKGEKNNIKTPNGNHEQKKEVWNTKYTTKYKKGKKKKHQYIFYDKQFLDYVRIFKPEKKKDMYRISREDTENLCKLLEIKSKKNEDLLIAIETAPMLYEQIFINMDKLSDFVQEKIKNKIEKEESDKVIQERIQGKRTNFTLRVTLKRWKFLINNRDEKIEEFRQDLNKLLKRNIKAIIGEYNMNIKGLSLPEYNLLFNELKKPDTFHYPYTVGTPECNHSVYCSAFLVPCLVENGKLKLLLGKRKRDDKWFFIGGKKLKKDITPFDTMLRKVQQELYIHFSTTQIEKLKDNVHPIYCRHADMHNSYDIYYLINFNDINLFSKEKIKNIQENLLKLQQLNEEYQKALNTENFDRYIKKRYHLISDCYKLSYREDLVFEKFKFIKIIATKKFVSN